jgi:hypothetical protein
MKLICSDPCPLDRFRTWGSCVMRGYELSDFEWGVIAPLLPNKSTTAEF